jgi:hypothetical protein
MPLLNSLAIFVLGTTKMNGRHRDTQNFATYYESRILPITNTYATLYNDYGHKEYSLEKTNLFFVFGNARRDVSFLGHHNCRREQKDQKQTEKEETVFSGNKNKAPMYIYHYYYYRLYMTQQ